MGCLEDFVVAHGPDELGFTRCSHIVGNCGLVFVDTDGQTYFIKVDEIIKVAPINVKGRHLTVGIKKDYRFASLYGPIVKLKQNLGDFLSRNLNPETRGLAHVFYSNIEGKIPDDSQVYMSVAGNPKLEVPLVDLMKYLLEKYIALDLQTVAKA